jgi:hypothetical protein
MQEQNLYPIERDWSDAGVLLSLCAASPLGFPS